MKTLLWTLLVLGTPALADTFDNPVKIEDNQVVGESPDRVVQVCQNQGSTMLYVFDEKENSALAAFESRARLQFRNGYFTLAGYAVKGKAGIEELDAYTQNLPADRKLDCSKSATEQYDRLNDILIRISRKLPFYQPLWLIPNFKIIRGYNLTIDPRESPHMPVASCSNMTVEQLNQSLRSKLTYFTLGDFRQERFCR